MVLGRPWPILLAIAVVVPTVVLLADRRQPYEVQAAFDSAVSIARGMDVQVRGVDVGKVTKVEYRDGKAIVGVGVSDERIFPLPAGTTATLRFGATIGNGTRYVELHPGRAGGPTIPDGGAIPARSTTTPVEIDQILDTLDARTRRALVGALDGTASATRGRAADVGRALRTAPAGVRATRDVLADLVADDHALRALVVNSDRVTRVLAGRGAAVGDMVTAARAAIDAFAARADGVRATLSELPATLRQARRTLGRTDGSLVGVDGLLADLAPGARRVPALAGAARRALTRLDRVAPVAVSTLRTARDAAPQVTELLRTATPFVDGTRRALADLAPMLACVRLYTPEIAGFPMTWGSATKNYDDRSHYARVHLKEGVTSLNGVVPNAATAVALGQRYAMPRPPGLNAGRPTFHPECGVTKDALDPTKDPERVR